MHTKKRSHVLMLVVIIMFLLSIFIHNISASILLEYQRAHNNILFYKSEEKLDTAVKDVFNYLKKSSFNNFQNDRNFKQISFIPDTLEANCNSGIIILKEESLPCVTFSIRK